METMEGSVCLNHFKAWTLHNCNSVVLEHVGPCWIENIQIRKMLAKNELRHEKTGFFWGETKEKISFAVTAKLISAFVFTTRIAQFFYFLNPKFQPLAIFCSCTGRFVSDLVVNPAERFSNIVLVKNIG